MSNFNYQSERELVFKIVDQIELVAKNHNIVVRLGDGIDVDVVIAFANVFKFNGLSDYGLKVVIRNALSDLFQEYTHTDAAAFSSYIYYSKKGVLSICPYHLKGESDEKA